MTTPFSAEQMDWLKANFKVTPLTPELEGDKGEGNPSGKVVFKA